MGNMGSAKKRVNCGKRMQHHYCHDSVCPEVRPNKADLTSSTLSLPTMSNWARTHSNVSAFHTNHVQTPLEHQVLVFNLIRKELLPTKPMGHFEKSLLILGQNIPPSNIFFCHVSSLGELCGYANWQVFPCPLTCPIHSSAHLIGPLEIPNAFLNMCSISSVVFP